jgi:hypothetical protein
MNDNSGGCRTHPRTWSARAGLLAVVAVTALLTVACGGGSGSTPGVASLGTGSGNGSGASAASGSNSNATQLLDEWATCIRSHGDPNQADPAIDNDDDIEIYMINVPKALENQVHGMTGPCSNYLAAASKELSGGQPQPTDNPVQDAKFAECMRANGYPNYPDPGTNGETNFQGTGIDPNSSAIQPATKKCDNEVGQPYYPPSYQGPGGAVQVMDCSAPAGAQCPKTPPSARGSGGSGPIPAGSPGSGSNG